MPEQVGDSALEPSVGATGERNGTTGGLRLDGQIAPNRGSADLVPFLFPHAGKKVSRLVSTAGRTGCNAHLVDSLFKAEPQFFSRMVGQSNPP